MHDEHLLRQTIVRMFAEHLHIEVPATDNDLLEAGLLDSLSLVELLVQIERQFQVTVAIEDLDLDDFRTVDRIARYVAQASSVRTHV